MVLEWICFTGWSSRWPLYRLGRERAYNQNIQVARRSWLSGQSYRRYPLSLYRTPQPLGWGTLLIANLEGGCYSRNLQVKSFMGCYLHLVSTRICTHWRGKVDPFSETYGQTLLVNSIFTTTTCYLGLNLSSI